MTGNERQKWPPQAERTSWAEPDSAEVGGVRGEGGQEGRWRGVFREHSI